MIQQYEVGKRFPHEKYLNRGEITVAILNEQFFDILVCMPDPTAEEIRDFRRGVMAVNLYEQHNVPFIVVQFADGFNVDVNINMYRTHEERRDGWLNAEANAISLYLVDSHSGILHAMRTIGVPCDFANKIRDVCEAQLQEEVDVNDVDDRVKNVMGGVTTKDMVRNAIKTYRVR
jgi:hypothetical protein